PMPEIGLVAVLLRCSYHDYYGLGVIGIAFWAAVFVWLFVRTGSVLPLVGGPIIWDISIFLGQRWHSNSIINAHRSILLCLAAGVTWLIDLKTRRTGPPGRRPPSTGVPAATPGSVADEV